VAVMKDETRKLLVSAAQEWSSADVAARSLVCSQSDRALVIKALAEVIAEARAESQGTKDRAALAAWRLCREAEEALFELPDDAPSAVGTNATARRDALRVAWLEREREAAGVR
jgi:hypothetical protein